MLPILRSDNRLNQVPSLLDWAFPELATTQPNVLPLNIQEDESNYYFSLDLPGVKKEDVAITLKDNVLQIKGERSLSTTSGNALRSERWSGSFSRTLKLPTNLDSSNIQAELKDGVLSLVVNKTEASKARTIDIK